MNKPLPARALPGARLAVIGGRLEDDNAAIYAELHRMSGGRILVFPTASGEPREVGEEQVEVFRGHGFDSEMVELTTETADWMPWDQPTLDKVADFGSVYFTGGDQALIVAALAPGGAETPLLGAIRAAQGAGGLVSGSSAGAAMMSEPMILGGTSLEAMVHGVTEDPVQPGLLMGKGLGFFPFGMVDQHFIKRGRLGRMVVAMRAAGVPVGFGVDENTALLVEGGVGRVCGEYGMIVIDGRRADKAAGDFVGLRLSYLDHGDAIDLGRLRPLPHADKRRVRAGDIAYRAPGNSRRNVFGAYAIYDLMTRLVLGDPSCYTADRGEAFDARSGVNVKVELERVRGASACLIAKPESGLRMTATQFRCSLRTETLSATRVADRIGRRVRSFGMAPADEASIVLLGSSPLGDGGGAMLSAIRDRLGPGPVGIFAAASSEPRRTAREHVKALSQLGIEAVDLQVSIDTIDYADQNEELLEKIAGLRAILLCGGNQIRLVETLLHRGEESAVLAAIARAHALGASLIAASGAASALSSVMIAGGTSREALRYGVTSDLGHPGLVVQEGIGLFAGGIIDQNLISSGRLGRLVVACAEENERFGIGVCEESAVISTHAGLRLEARGRHGFVLVDVDAGGLSLQGDNFVATGVKLALLAPGDSADLETGVIHRQGSGLSNDLLGEMAADLLRAGGKAAAAQIDIRIADDPYHAVLDLSFPRDESS